MDAPDIGGFSDLFMGIAIVGTLVSVLVPLAIVVLVVWAIRRSMPARHDPAETELRGRLARGEIDMAEFQVRLRALKDADES
ncbi:MAG: hypothetical protein L0227_19530 [Chloroflexi bacterium]|nr:hypothetical protein [Chloroflexota bacterium]